MSEDETAEEQGSQLDRFASASLRGPKRGIYQQLLALLLIKANRSNDYLIKISCICEAALMSRKKEKLNMDMIDVIYAIAKSFSASEAQPTSSSWLHPNSMIDLVEMAWTFPKTEENYKKFISPWWSTPLRYYPYHTDFRIRNYPLKNRITFDYGAYSTYYNRQAEYLEKLKKVVRLEIAELPEWQNFFEKTSALSKKSFHVLQGEFSGWALKQLLETQAIISEEVDPEIYAETLALTIKAEREEAKL